MHGLNGVEGGGRAAGRVREVVRGVRGRLGIRDTDRAAPRSWGVRGVERWRGGGGEDAGGGEAQPGPLGRKAASSAGSSSIASRLHWVASVVK